MKNNNYTLAEFKSEAFHCPLCNTYAQQDWENDQIFLQKLFNYLTNLFMEHRKKLASYEEHHIADFLAEIRSKFLKYRDRNYYLATCQHCKKYSIWIDEKMVYPLTPSAPNPAEDMPVDVKEIYEEARQVQLYSPRASAALLRVALEKLTVHLGEETGNLNTRIKNLNEKGLPDKVIKSLDTVRITAGEGGSHSGKIDLTGEDNKEIVNKLFLLVNLIVEKTITEPEEIEKQFNQLPEDKKEGIKNRDNNN